MAHRIADIAAALGATLHGDPDLLIERAAEPADAGPRDLALAMDPKYAEGLAQGQARSAFLWQGADWQALGLTAALTVERPRFAMAGLSRLLDPGYDIAPGVHPSAIVDPTAQIGADVSIGPLAVIGAGARIGAGSRIAAHVSIGAGTEIGAQSLLLARVHIGANVRIGARFIAQPGAVIGGDGFSFVTAEPSAVEAVRETLGDQKDAAGQPWIRIQSLGSVCIGDDVELGANTCVDRGTIRDTRIGDGVKVDNLTQIGHNVEIGNHCLICAQVGIAGSSRIGHHVVLGGQTGISDNIFIGDGAITGGATKVLSNVPAGRVMLGYPAIQMQAHIDSHKGFRRLPRLFRDVADLKKAVSKLGQSD